MQLKQRVPSALRRRAAEGTKKKIRLEAKLSAKLRRFFSKIGNQFRKQLADGVVLDAAVFDEELRRILKNHYVKVFNAFSGTFSETLKAINFELETKQDEDNQEAIALLTAIILAAGNTPKVRRAATRAAEEAGGIITPAGQAAAEAAANAVAGGSTVSEAVEAGAIAEQQSRGKNATKLIESAARKVKPSKVEAGVRVQRNEFIEGAVTKQSQFILNTTQQDLNKSATNRQAEAIAAISVGALITRAEMAKRARGDFRDKTMNRPDSIALDQTETVAEKAKELDANETVAIVAGAAVVISSMKKIWITVGDDKVRNAHQEAEGQTVPATEAFLVGGEQLMQPKDTSLGASAGNVIHCRCSAERFIDLPI